MEDIVLDKSYLDAATPAEVEALCSGHRVIMPDVLFYELTTARETSMRNCFNKFPDIDNPVALVPNVGTLLRYELTTREPSTPLYDQRERKVFRFNSRLRSGTFKFTEAQLDTRRGEEAAVKEETEEFFRLAMMVAAFFPQISGIPYADLPAEIQAAKTRIAADISTVRTIYEQLSSGTARSPAPIPAGELDEKWASFRWVQVRCLYSLDLIFKYDGRLPSNPTARFWTRVEHDMLDSEYVMLASLSGAFACNETRMTQFFRLIRPDGVLFRAEGAGR